MPKINIAISSFFFCLALLGLLCVACKDGPPIVPIRIYAVKFDTRGAVAMRSASVISGQKMLPPTSPTKEGNTFVGWFEDALLTTPFDFNTPITKDITLYAKWLEHLNVLSFVLPSREKAGITENIAATIDEVDSTITLVINVPSSANTSELSNLLPQIRYQDNNNTFIKGNIPTDYSKNSETTLTLKHKDGREKTYKLIVAFASFYLKLDPLIDPNSIQSYGIELYTPKYQGDHTRFQLTIKTTTTFPFAMEQYFSKQDTLRLVVYGKNSRGDTIAVLSSFIQNNIAKLGGGSTGKGTLLRLNAIPEGQGLIITHIDHSVWTCTNWDSELGESSIPKLVSANWEVAPLAAAPYFKFDPSNQEKCDHSDYYVLALKPDPIGVPKFFATLSAGSHLTKQSDTVTMDFTSYGVVKPHLVF